MALNLDTAIRVVAKVAGLNEFQALTDSLGKVQSTAESSAAGLQQTAAGSARTAQEAAKAAAASRAQATALQELQAKSRSSAAELQRMGVEARSVGGAVQQLRGQTGGAFDQLAGGATKAANNIRELTLSFQPTEQQLSRLRNQVLEFGAANKQSERTLKQQVDALKNLRSQAEINGSLYQQLTNDIERVSNASKGMGAAVQSGVEGLRRVEAGSRSSAAAIQEQIKSLQQLQTAFVKGSDDYKELGRDIDQLKQKLGELGAAPEPGIRGIKMMARAMEESVAKQETAIGKLRQVLNSSVEGYRAVGQQIEDLKRKAAGFNPQELMTPGGAARGVAGAVGSMVQLRRDLARSMAGRVVLTGEGLAAAGVAGGVGAGAAAGVGGMAAGADAVATSLSHVAAQAQALPGVLKPLGGLLATPFADAAAGIANWGASLGAAQAKLTALSAPFEAIGHAISAIGPEGAAAAGAASLAIASVYQVLSNQADKAQAEAEAAFKGISDSAQKALQDLVKIYEKVPAARMEAQERLRQQNLERLANAPSGSVEARQAANAVAVAEREIAKIKGEQNQLLDQARSRQQAGSEALKSQVQIARDRLEVQRKLTAEIKASAEEDRLARQIAGAIRRNEERTRPQREAEAEAAARTQGLIEQAKQRLQQQQALTAEIKRSNAELADERAIRNSIRRYEERQQQAADRAAREQADLARRAAEAFAPSKVLALPAAGQTTFQGAVSAEGFGGGARRLTNFETAGTRDVVGAAMASQTNASAAGAEKLRGKLAQLFIEIDKVEAASNGSVGALQRQRAAWEALRVAVNPAAPAYEKARLKVQELDAQLQKLSGTQEKVAKRGFAREALGGAMGALATGGGVQGALGSAAGTLAFSGSAAGMLAGAGITAVAGIGMLATRTGLEAETAQVRLKALTEQFGEYNQAQAAAARIAKTLRLSTTEAQDGFSKLYAALRPTGISVKELEDAYIGFNAAARASGATAEESSAALLQLKQALGSGVLQGDELRSIREQAPLVGQAIAKEMGVTVGELKKLGEEGKITTDVVLKALASLKNSELGKLGPQFDTGAQAVKDFQIALDNVGRRLASIFGPAALAGLRVFTAVLERTADVLDGSSTNKASLRIKAGQLAAEEATKRFNVGDRLTRYGEFQEFTRQRTDQIYQRLLSERQASLQPKDDATSAQLRAQQQARQERDKASGRAAAEQREKAFKDELKIRQDAEGKLADAAKQHAEQLADFQLQTIKRAQDLERQLGDQRLQIEREIAQSRLSAARAQQDVGLELEKQRLSALGLDTGSIDVAKATIETFRQFEDQVTQGRQTALDRQLNLQRQLEEFKVSTAEGLGKIQEAYAKSVSNILQDAGDKLAEKMINGAQQAASALSGGGNGGNANLPISGGSKQQALMRAAQILGVSPVDLATIISFETGGTFNPSQWGGAGGRYMGLIQFGPNERRRYGARQGQSFEEQVQGPVVRYLQDRFQGVGMSTRGADLLTLYRTVLGGNPKASLNAADAFGTTPVSGVARMGPDRRRALQFLGLSADGAAGLAQPAVDAARGQLNQQAAALRNQMAQAQAESRKSSFAAGASARESQFSGIIGNLDAQIKSAREALEDEYRYQDLLSQKINPETAKRRIELERIVSTEKTSLTAQRDIIQQQIKSGKYSKEEVSVLQQQVDKINARIAAQSEVLSGVEAITEATKTLQKAREDAEGRDIGKGLKDGVKGYLESIGTLAEGIKGATGNALKGLEDQLVTFVTTGKASFKELARSILEDMSRILIQQMVMKPLLQGIGGLFNIKFADGGIMTAQGPVPLRTYSSGGIANSPQLAMFGEGSMPEAYVPLPDGRRIPVAMKGGGAGGGTNVVVNVDASGSQVQGDAGKGEQLGRVVSQAVQQELIRQRRPGGLLAA